MHVGCVMILKRCKYVFVFPFPVSMAAKFCVRFIFILIRSSTFGEYSFVMLPLVVCVLFLCLSFTLSSSISLVSTIMGFYCILLLMTRPSSPS